MIKRAQEILLEKNIRAKERVELINLLESIKRDLESNLPFVKSMFEESMDKSVAAGKNEIDAFLKLVVSKAGMSALLNENSFNYLTTKDGEDKDQA